MMDTKKRPSAETPSEYPPQNTNAFSSRARALHTVFLSSASLNEAIALQEEAMRLLAASMDTFRTDSDAEFARELIAFGASLNQAAFAAPDYEEARRAMLEPRAVETR